MFSATVRREQNALPFPSAVGLQAQWQAFFTVLWACRIIDNLLYFIFLGLDIPLNQGCLGRTEPKLGTEYFAYRGSWSE